MPTVIYGKNGAQTTVLSTEISALGNGSTSSAGSAFDNRDSALGYPLADFELYAPSGTNMTAGATCDLYMQVSYDGTNYGQSVYLGSFVCAASTTNRMTEVRQVALPLALIKFVLKNSSGVAFSASTPTLKISPTASQF